jgi:molybdate-binding protein
VSTRQAWLPGRRGPGSHPVPASRTVTKHSRLPATRTADSGHAKMLKSMALGLGDAGIASEPAALAYGLASLPLTAEHFDLVIPAGHESTREVQGLLKVLSSAWLLDQLASLPGY